MSFIISLKRFLVRIGIGLFDLFILTAGLLYIYLGTSPTGGIRLFAANALTIFLVVIGLYLGVVMASTVLLNPMRTEGWLSNTAKSIVSTIIIVALFSWFLVPFLWLFGYNLNADVDIKNTLIVISLIRSLFKIWLGRRFGGGSPSV